MRIRTRVTRPVSARAGERIARLVRTVAARERTQRAARPRPGKEKAR